MRQPLVTHTQAFVNGAQAAGAKYVKPGISESPETDLQLALGWPRMRYLVDGHPDGQLTDLTTLKDKIFDSYDEGVPTELAARRIRTMTAFMCDSDGTWRDAPLKALKDGSAFTPQSAATFIRENLASKAESMGLNGEVYALLEALVGPDVVLGAIVDALEQAPQKRLEDDDRKLWWMVRWLSRLMLRVHVDRAPKLRARLATLYRSIGKDGRLVDDFDQALHGPKAEQATRSLVDISLWNDVPAATVIAAVQGLELTRYSFSPEPRLVMLAGEPIVELYRKKWNLLHDAADQRALVAQFGVLRVPGIAALMAELAAKSKAKKQAQAWLDAHPDLARDSAKPAPIAAKIDFKQLDPQQILGQLDASVEGNDWADFFELDPEDRYHGMRLVAARNATDWGLVIERLQGCNDDSAQVKRWRFGSRVPEPGLDDGDAPISFTVEDGEMVGPEGPLVMKSAMIKTYDLGACETPWETAFRAYAAHFPNGVWPGLGEVVARLNLASPGQVIIESRAWEHVPLNGKKQILPSQSKVFQSLAAAIASADARLWKPGKPNTDWRIRRP